jgi:hypothetical protein
MVKHIEHNDPIRFPKLISPIEEEMIDIHKIGINNLVKGINKILLNSINKDAKDKDNS